MKIVELSHLLKDDIPVFPGDPSFSLTEEFNHTGQGFSLSHLKTGFHVGTHIDAPYHFNPSGRKVKDIALEEVIGPAQKVELNEQILKKSHLKNISSDKILIIQTGWDVNWDKSPYFKNNPYLSLEAAELLVKIGIRGIGIDSPSVDAWGETKIHHMLLSNDIWIVENLTNLNQIASNQFEISLIPLLIDAEGSMVRAFSIIP